LKIFDSSLLTSPYFVRSLVGLRPKVQLIDDMASGVDSFSQKMSSQILGVYYNPRHILNNFILPLLYTILFRSDR
jgi:hypothetical protein